MAMLMRFMSLERRVLISTEVSHAARAHRSVSLVRMLRWVDAPAVWYVLRATAEVKSAHFEVKSPGKPAVPGALARRSSCLRRW